MLAWWLCGGRGSSSRGCTGTLPPETPLTHGGAHAGRCRLSKKLFQEEKQNPAASSNSRCAEQESHGAGQSRPCCAVCVLLGSLSCEVASRKEVVPSWCSLLCVEELSLQHKPSLAEQNECPQCTINPFAKWWLSQWFHRVPLPEEKLLSLPGGLFDVAKPILTNSRCLQSVTLLQSALKCSYLLK